MPTVSKTWDIVSLFEHYAGVQVVGRGSTVYGVFEVHSNCPWCPGSDDSFIMRPETGQFSHSIRSGGCNRTGDGIDLLMDDFVGPGMTRTEAIETLGLQDVSFYDPEKLNNRHENSSDIAPPKKWQEQALIALTLAERYLWMDIGKSARNYLHSRGLSDEILKKKRFAYMPLNDKGSWYSMTFEECGLDPAKYPGKDAVRIPNGILIPYFVGGQIWKLEMIRPGEKRMPKGQVVGSTDCLYNVDAIQYGDIAMINESVLDAVSVEQEAGDLVTPVATGGTPKCTSSRWIAELSLAKFILQSFDEDGGGDKGAQFWLDTFHNIERWSPMLWNDPNALLQAQIAGTTDGYTLRQWVEQGVDLVKHIMNIDLTFPTLAREVQEELEIAPAREFLSDPQVEEELTEQELSEDDKLLIYADTVRQIVDVFGGPDKVTMTRHDGRTLEQHIGATATYKPVTLPDLPRKKCPHGLVTLKRKSDEMANGIHAECRAKPLDHGWCEYHACAHELLQLGAKLGFPEVDLTVSVIDHGKRQNIGRWILSGVACWEAHAETTAPKHIQEDMKRMKARYGLN